MRVVPMGRCAGCGKVDASVRVMSSHVISCPEFRTVFVEDPARALLPPAEYVRWSEEENHPDARARVKDVALSKRFAELDQRRVGQVERWAIPKDILDD